MMTDLCPDPPLFPVVNCTKSALDKMAAEKDIQPVQTVNLLYYGVSYRSVRPSKFHNKLCQCS